LQIKIIAVGKCREKYYADAVREYLKRLSRFASVQIVEIADEPAPDALSNAQLIQIKQAEGKRILARIGAEERVVALCIGGKRYDSVQWAQHWQQKMNQGSGRWCFIIGGSNGLSDDVLRRADEQLSFSDFTFCHQLMRVVLLEQIYRAMKILRGESYHK